MFKELKQGSKEEVEKSFIESWDDIDLLNKSIEKGNDYFVFYDGPATANGFPGLHHMMAKFLKDSFCKYKTMQGFKVHRKVGWDTHGLPVEVEVEKRLGFKSKTDIESYGIEKFNQECRKIVWDNEKAFTDLTKKMGQLIDIKNPYVTYNNDYIETEWWILKKFFDEGLFYEGVKILPYCTRCGTGLASHEVAQGYKEIPAETVIVAFKLKEENTYFLVWTTTPWTLISNVALCVHPEEEYVKVKSKDNNYIVAKKLLGSIFDDEYEILETYTGKDLEYKEYEQLLPFLNVDKKAFYVTCDTYVTMEDGTGIVHIAPAFGEDDAKIGKKYNLPYLNPVGEDGCYLEGPWKGIRVFEADLKIIDHLKETKQLFKKQRMMHNYPHCWRCTTPLLYYSKPSYYLEVTKLQDKIIEANNKVHWHPEYVGEKRFGNWLSNMNDWAISRNRYWGTPLPLWRCSCGHMEMIGSRKELVEKANENIDETIDLHRPYVDEVTIKCSKCGQNMNRVKDVIDCWFDSGSMPFAQNHYPFENEDFFEKQFPADFISEGIDQTRGWFYSLLVISTFLKGCAPYKNVLVNDLLLDKDGKKMSKSKGNIVEPFTTMKEYGADTVRFYLPYVSPVWTPLKFDMNGLKEVYSKFFNPLKNTYTFFAMYANLDKIDPRNYKVAYEDLENIDKWLLSKYHHLLKYVTESYEEYDLNKVVRALANFVSEDLSNWYIRRNRDRFWESEETNSKKAVYQTTYEVLLGLAKITAPIAPFITEEIYQNLTGELSVHLSSFPKYEEKYFLDDLEEKMDLVRNLISLGRKQREEKKIKVRQPLKEIILDGKHQESLNDLKELIKEELNVKEVLFETDLSKYMNFTVKPNFKEAGKVVGSKMKDFVTFLANLSDEDIKKLRNNETITFDKFTITSDLVDLRVLSKDGFDAAFDGNLFVILNTTITEDLRKEGIAREFVSKIQNLRKEKDFEISDRINIYYEKEEEFEKVIEEYKEYIKNETLALEFIEKDNLTQKYDLNGIEIKCDIERK